MDDVEYESVPHKRLRNFFMLELAKMARYAVVHPHDTAVLFSDEYWFGNEHTRKKYFLGIEKDDAMPGKYWEGRVVHAGQVDRGLGLKTKRKRRRKNEEGRLSRADY